VFKPGGVVGGSVLTEHNEIIVMPQSPPQLGQVAEFRRVAGRLTLHMTASISRFDLPDAIEWDNH
jgi:hypothetical protein